MTGDGSEIFIFVFIHAPGLRENTIKKVYPKQNTKYLKDFKYFCLAIFQILFSVGTKEQWRNLKNLGICEAVFSATEFNSYVLSVVPLSNASLFSTPI